MLHVWSNRSPWVGIMDMIYSHIYGWHVGQPSWGLFWVEVGCQGRAIPRQGCFWGQHTVGGARARRGEPKGAGRLLWVSSQLRQEEQGSWTLGKLQSLVAGGCIWRGARGFNEGQKMWARGTMKYKGESKPGSATSDRAFLLNVKLRGHS